MQERSWIVNSLIWETNTWCLFMIAQLPSCRLTFREYFDYHTGRFIYIACFNSQSGSTVFSTVVVGDLAGCNSNMIRVKRADRFFSWKLNYQESLQGHG
jgi:hypothetical protein